MKTFTVIGLGRFGTSIATQLFNMGYEVLAIDKNMDKINAIANLVTRAACTDAHINIGLRLILNLFYSTIRVYKEGE